MAPSESCPPHKGGPIQRNVYGEPPTRLSIPGLLHLWRHLVPTGQQALPYLPERLSRALLEKALRPHPELWGWSTESDRRYFACESYRRAFPEEDAEAFLAAATGERARALATSLTYIARTQAGRRSGLIEPHGLEGSIQEPCIVAHLHYSIDPVIQLALLAANTRGRLKWAVYPAQPDGTFRREGERSLFLAATIPDSISEALLYVNEPSWLVAGLRHVKQGGSLLIALDSLLDSRRPSSASLSVGQATMPISPAIDLLAGIGGARLLFAWPEPRPNGTWNLHCDRFADLSSLAIAASRWIERNRVLWTGWPYLTWRLKRTEMQRDLVPFD
jgi:hypothetical protein